LAENKKTQEAGNFRFLRFVFLIRFPAVELAQLAQVLVALGCPSEKSSEMAAQLDKRAKQLAAEKNRSYDEALKHLLTLMKQGWAANKNL
jgi:hypothetical protein